MQDLRVTLLQTDCLWHQPKDNLKEIGTQLATLKEPTDLIVLPEMFNTGFTMQVADWAEPEQGPSYQWLAEQAQKHQAVVVGSVIVKQAACYYNRLVWMQPNGKYQHYNKRHLFRMANEHHYYTAGKDRLLVELKGWRILPLICYDLRFPLWSRNLVSQPYDLLIYIANWPARRRHAWNTLLQARAIENLCYVAGVNRVGIDGNKISYAGDSTLIDMLGETSIDKTDRAFVKTLTLSADDLLKFRQQFPAHLDGDQFSLKT